MSEESVRDRADRLGLKVYDTAIPQDWADAVRAKTGIYPPGHVVWCYDNARAFGEPVAVG